MEAGRQVNSQRRKEVQGREAKILCSLQIAMWLTFPIDITLANTRIKIIYNSKNIALFPKMASTGFNAKGYRVTKVPMSPHLSLSPWNSKHNQDFDFLDNKALHAK